MAIELHDPTRMKRKIQAALLALTLLLLCVGPVFGQRDRRDRYYNGMRGNLRRGDYDRYSNDYDRRHHRDSGGIGPGKGALIGGAGGAALGAIFGRSLKGSLIGGAAGAGIGALAGKLAQGDDNDHRRRRR